MIRILSHPLMEVFRIPEDPDADVTDEFVEWLHENPSPWLGEPYGITLQNPGSEEVLIANGQLIARRREAPDQPWFYCAISEGDLIMFQKALAT